MLLTLTRRLRFMFFTKTTKYIYLANYDLINSSTSKYFKLLADTNEKSKIKQIIASSLTLPLSLPLSPSSPSKKPAFLNVVVVLSLLGVSFYFYYKETDFCLKNLIKY